jgi:hypothetical protein
MAKMIAVSIDLSKIDKAKIKSKDKEGNPFKNGAQYYDITISVNDTKNEYGQDVSVFDAQSKEQREAKENKNYLGNGKVFWSSDGQSSAAPSTGNAKEEPKDLHF